MKFSTMRTAASAILFSTSALAATTSSCLRDNVFRCLLTSSAVASPYCSSFISIPVVTVTVTTVTPVTTITTTTTGTAITTENSTVQTTTTAPGFAKRADVSPIWVNGVAYHPDSTPIITARAVVATSPAPNCLKQVSSTLYPASRISSACSCLSVTPSTISVTATAPIVTSTATSSTTTLTTLSTVTTSAVSTMQTCPTIISAPGINYKQYYKGSGFTEDLNNPGNSNSYPAQTTTFSGSMAACDVLQACADYAAALTNIYYQFDLHFLGSVGVYECRAFYNGNSDPAFFNVANADVVSGVGYTRN